MSLIQQVMINVKYITDDRQLRKVLLKGKSNWSETTSLKVLQKCEMQQNRYWETETDEKKRCRKKGITKEQKHTLQSPLESKPYQASLRLSFVS